MAIVEVRDLTRRFGEFTAVDGVSFDVEPGGASQARAAPRRELRFLSGGPHRSGALTPVDFPRGRGRVPSNLLQVGTKSTGAG